MGEENSSDTFFNQHRSSRSSNMSRKRAHFLSQSSQQDSFSAALAATFASIPDFDPKFSTQKRRESKIEDCELLNDSLSPDIYALKATPSAILSSMVENSGNIKIHKQILPKGSFLNQFIGQKLF